MNEISTEERMIESMIEWLNDKIVCDPEDGCGTCGKLIPAIRKLVEDHDELKADVKRLKEENGYFIGQIGELHTALYRAEAEVEAVKRDWERGNQALDVMRIRAEKAEAELESWKKEEAVWKETEAGLLARLAEVKPLVEAVMKAPMKVLRDLPSGGYSDIGPNTYTGDILRAANAFRAAREGKDGR